jgi:hypothetical protein
MLEVSAPRWAITPSSVLLLPSLLRVCICNLRASSPPRPPPPPPSAHLCIAYPVAPPSPPCVLVAVFLKRARQSAARPLCAGLKQTLRLALGNRTARTRWPCWPPLP